jgi:CubicO group peptidase (beta-lactamase class C family)
VATLVARGGEIVHHHTVGYSDVAAGTPLGEDAIYRIYSMSKPVTVAALLTLLEEGRYVLDDPVSRYMPELGNMQVYRGMEGDKQAFSPPARPVTIRHLMMHTAGMTYGYFGDTADYCERVWGESGLLRSDHDLADAMTNVACLPLLFDPGDRWHYSVSIDVLGRLIEVLSGQTFDAFLSERLFGPLGMRDTGFWTRPGSESRLATLYGQDPNGTLVPIDSPLGPFDAPKQLLSGGGGLTSTIMDYWRFAQMLANGGELDGVRILGPRTVGLMRGNHLPASIGWYGDPPHAGHGFGLGVRVMVDPAAAGEMGSPGNWGWSGLATTDYWVDPVTGIVGIYMTQFIAPPMGGYPVHLQFRNLVYQALVD